MKCRGPKRNRNKFAIGKGRSLRMEGRTVDHMVASVMHHGDCAEGYTPRPRQRVEVFRRGEHTLPGGGK